MRTPPSTPSNSTPSNSTRSKNRCYLIALTNAIVTIVLAGATFAVVYFLKIIVEPDCTFNVGQPGNFPFEVFNMTDWTELYISQKFTVPVASANRTRPNMEIV
ncbi:uncharacterized protein LOC127856979 isoform X2 [Dreissena polymorpha]|uniref:uncharacterized protein LOC127856979 isoform X2 n=1 Tax=Dreissena polymorpha TaxID=45954 RepID=UPI002264942B|nr:uncharacterized protein LOC127856979 isoform X2 [Dreissena polymorpha]